MNRFWQRFAPWTALTIVCLANAMQAQAADAVPDWLRAQATVALPAYEEKTDAVVLYDELVVTVAPTGKIKYLQRRALRILRPDGERWGVVRVNFDNQSRITNLRAWALPANGKPFVVKEKEAIETAVFGVEDGSLVSDVRTRVLTIPAAIPGNTIGYEWEQEERPYLLTSEWDFQDNIPVRIAKFTLNLAPGWNYQASWLNHAAVAPVSGAPNQWHWSLTELPAIKIERAMPPWRKIAARMSLSLVKPGMAANKALSWADIGIWYTDLARGRQAVTPEMRQKVIELGNGKTLLGKLNALARFVQTDIRYVGIQLETGGHQPHPAADVFASRYGDCKDKATLLASLLREIGIESYYFFVNTERGAVNATTAPNLGFNHVILAIALPDEVNDPSLLAVMQHPSLGRLLFFDPTQAYTPLGRLDGSLQDNYGLLATNSNGELFALPQLRATSSYVRRTAQLKLNAQGDLNGDFQDVRAGDSATSARYGLRLAAQESDRIKPVESLLADSLANFHLQRASVINLDAIELPFEWRYSLAAPKYAKLAGDLMMVRPRILGSQSTNLLETREARQHPIEFDGPALDSDVFEIALPDGYEVEELPPPTHLDIGYLAYNSKTELAGRLIRYSRTLEVRQLSVPASKAEQLKQFYRAIHTDERHMMVLKRSVH